jgi:hypothetical protein
LRICEILFTPDHQNRWGLTPIVADISLTHPFVGNAVDREQWDSLPTRERDCQRAQVKRLKQAWAESSPIVVPLVSDTLGSMTGKSAVTLCLFAPCRAVKETESPIGCAPEALAASKRGKGHRPRCPRRKELSVPQERGCPFPGDGAVRASVSVLQQQEVRERTPDPTCPQPPAGGLGAWSGWSCNQ